MNHFSGKLNWFSRFYLWLTERLYNEFAWAYDLVSWVVSAGNWATCRREAIRHIAGKRVLELGFGTGELLIDLQQHAYDAYGLESSPAMHKVTTRKLLERGFFSIPRIYGLAQHLPFPNSSFDTVVSTFPSNYILDPETLAEVKRVLQASDPKESKDGGRLVIVGLFTEHKGKRFGWITEEYLLNEEKRMKWMPGWDVELIKPTQRLYSFPVVILKK